MYSIPLAFTAGPLRCLLPIVEGKISAGFPSPDDFATKRHDLNELLITHPLVTFFWQVSGESLREAGIFDSDTLVVNRALRPVIGASSLPRSTGNPQTAFAALSDANDCFGASTTTASGRGCVKTLCRQCTQRIALSDRRRLRFLRWVKGVTDLRKHVLRTCSHGLGPKPTSTTTEFAQARAAADPSSTSCSWGSTACGVPSSQRRWREAS